MGDPVPTPTNSQTMTRRAAPRRAGSRRHHGRRWALVGALGLLAGVIAPLVVSGSVAGASTTVLLFSSATPGATTVTVPAGVTSVQITAVGGDGGIGADSMSSGGQGAVVTATAAVVPNDALTVTVAANGANQTNCPPGAAGGSGAGTGGSATGCGAGGGGASAVFEGATALVVAGGGGGGSSAYFVGGGNAGGTTGQPGSASGSTNGGEPGTQTGAGAAGYLFTPGDCAAFGTEDGSGMNGGNGDGGGGAGYYGGGGGCPYFDDGGGGGGSSYPPSDATGLNTTGKPSVTISFVLAADPCGLGLRSYIMSATSSGGNFVGVFCVDAAGTGTYTQYDESPPFTPPVTVAGIVKISGTTTSIAASGPKLVLLGEITSSSSRFTETAPPPMKSGTFTLTAGTTIGSCVIAGSHASPRTATHRSPLSSVEC